MKKPEIVLPRVCGARIFNEISERVSRAKNDRFRPRCVSMLSPKHALVLEEGLAEAKISIENICLQIKMIVGKLLFGEKVGKPS